jgi:hypothetical protein
MIISEEAYEREGRIYLATEIKVFRDPRGTEDTEILGLAWGIDPNTGLRRKLWGLADANGEFLSSMCYEVANPIRSVPVLLNDMRKRGVDKFTFHSGMPLWTTLEELTRALKELGLAAPNRFKGAPVPEALVANWDQPEADWWRRGVIAANAVTAHKLFSLAEECQSGVTYG